MTYSSDKTPSPSPFMAASESLWLLQLEKTAKSLEKRGFVASVLPTLHAAKEHVLQVLIPTLQPQTLSFGGSMTVRAAGLLEALLEDTTLDVLNTFDTSIGAEAMIELRRKALLVDCFITSVNALTKNGILLMLDGIGNRTAAVQFGPRTVILLVGRNKLCEDIDAGVARIKNFAAPANAVRLQRTTPCTSTGSCVDCASVERICSYWTIINRCFPAKRTHVLLVNEDIGF